MCGTQVHTKVVPLLLNMWNSVRALQMVLSDLFGRLTTKDASMPLFIKLGETISAGLTKQIMCR